MNTNNIISAPAAANLNGKEFRVVTIGSSGIDLCASSGTPIGTLIRGQNVQEDGTYVGKAIAVGLILAAIAVFFFKL